MMASRRRWTLVAVTATAAAVGGAAAAWHHHRLGLTLTHYDARGHLVVARRIIDSITPGWQQIGAVWLPLPHLLNAIPVQIDLFYRTGGSAVAISIAAFAAATGSIAWIAAALTGSAAAGAASAAVFALNPNVVYLQSTPMTEPLLMALTTASVALLIEWTRALHVRGSPPDERSRMKRSRVVGWLLALACLTRYEAWPIAAAALAAALWTVRRRGVPLGDGFRQVAGVAVYPLAAIVAFAVFSRVVVGQWFVANGFFVPENKALGSVWMAAKEVGWGLRMLSAPGVVAVAGAGAAILAIAGLLAAGRGDALIALSLGASALLPWSAFFKGHPFRIRYMVPLIAIEAIAAGVVAGAPVLPRRLRGALAAALVLLAVYELRPLDERAPMVIEAQWDRPNGPVRQRVTDCLVRARDGEKIMASMGSLGHYMQETSRSGFAIRDFLHEGNGDIWLAALDNSPRPFAGWILIEEKAEGGDMLAQKAREHPEWLSGYSRVCEGAGLALYRRDQNLKFIVNR
jgi:hypothetical protein